MYVRYVALFLFSVALMWGTQVHAALIDSQMDDSAQATKPGPNIIVAIGYVPTNNSRIAGIRFRVNTSGSGNYMCPTGNVLQYSGTSTPVTWTSDAIIGGIVSFATTTPDTNGNCSYTTVNQYGDHSPLAVSPSNYYIFLIAAGGSSNKWVSMNGKPYASTTPQSFFGYRPGGSYYYTWGTTGLDAPYFEFFDTAPPPVVPPDPCATPGACASNVLFLPGIEASRLYENLPCSNGVCETKLWEPNGDNLASQLAHDATGASVNGDIYVKKNDVIDNAYLPIKGNVYKSFIGQMNGLVTDKTINKWEAIPYDWRLTPNQILNSGAEIVPGKISYLIATSSPYIIQELKNLAATSKTGKVTIIAHSNGGLVTKALTEKLGADASKYIDKIVFVAVPQTGAPQAVGALLHGYDQGLPVSFLSYGLSDGAARTLAKNMPMTYNLVPSDSYFAQVHTPVVTFSTDPILAPFRTRYGDTISSSTSLRTFITDPWRLASSTTEGLNYPSVGNSSLLTNAETLHTDLDLWKAPTGITLYEIAGWGEKTLSQIQYYQGISMHCDKFVSVLSSCIKTPKIDYRPRMVLDGDGTVVTPSALWTPGAKRYWVDLQTYNGFFGTTKHASILEVPQLRTFIKNIITNNEKAILPEFISTSTPINTKPGTELQFSLHSPLTLNLYDDQGHHTGVSTTTGELEQDISGSRYMKFGEVQFISVPSSLHTILVMNGYAEGSFTLDAEEVSGDVVVASTTFAGIPSGVSTTATLDIPSGGLASAGALVVDENSDGHADIILTPKLGDTVVLDITPPEIQITFSTSTDALAFIGTDPSNSSGQADTAIVTSTTTYPALKKGQKEYKGTATTTVTARDAVGNMTALVYTEQLPSPDKRDTITLRALAYNGATTTLANAAVSYKWRINKNGAFNIFASNLHNTYTILESHYRPKKNKTIIMTKPIDLDDSDDDSGSDIRPTKLSLPGMVVPYMTTKKGSLIINY